MNKTFLAICFFSVLLILPLVGAGCSAGKQAEKQTAGKNRNENAQAGFKLDFPKGTVADLAIGKKISAMGMNEAGGVINASQIIVGLPDGGLGSPSGMASGTMATGTRFSGGNALNSQMRRSGNGQRPARVRSQARANGEIIKMDSNSLVLKTNDGGSKVVYFTVKTEIYIFKAPSAPVASSTAK